MSTSHRQRDGGRNRAKGVVAVVLGLVLAGLMVWPWPQGTPEPVVFGVVPAPLFFWVLWTALFVGYVAWLVAGWDPYREVVRRNLGSDTEPPQSES